MKPLKGDVMTKWQVSITEDVTVALVSHCRVKDSMLMPFTFEEKWWKLVSYEGGSTWFCQKFSAHVLYKNSQGYSGVK